MNIFQISEEFYRLMSKLEEQDGVLTPDDIANLEINEKNISDKLHAYKHIKDRIKSDTELIKDQKKSLDAHIEIMKNFDKRINKYLLEGVNIFGSDSKTGSGKSIKYPDLTVFTKSMPRLVFENEEYFINRFNDDVNNIINDESTEDNTIKRDIRNATFVDISVTINCNPGNLIKLFNSLKKEQILESFDCKMTTSISKSELLNFIKNQGYGNLNKDEYDSLVEGVTVNNEADIVVMR